VAVSVLALLESGLAAAATFARESFLSESAFSESTLGRGFLAGVGSHDENEAAITTARAPSLIEFFIFIIFKM
jgi:hypothetical protein